MILRPSCYQCQAKSGRSQSDITIADFWGIHTVFPVMDDDKGTGLLIINTAKGQSALKWNKLIYKETSAESAFRHNPSYFQSVSAHPRRESFFAALDSSTSVIDLIEKSLRKTVKQRIRLGLSRVKNIIKQMLKKLIGGGKYNVTHQSTPSPLDSHTSFIPSIPHNASISAILLKIHLWDG